MRFSPTNNRARKTEQGYAVLFIFLLVSLAGLALYTAMPRVAFESQRDKEQLLVNRGEEYRRAIQLYYRKFRKYPAKIEDLESTNGIRFLRSRYVDPMTGKDEWRFIHVGPGGVLTDSVTQKKDNKKQDQSSVNTFITEMRAIGDAGTGANTGVNVALRTRPSDAAPEGAAGAESAGVSPPAPMPGSMPEDPNAIGDGPPTPPSAANNAPPPTVAPGVAVPGGPSFPNSAGGSEYQGNVANPNGFPNPNANTNGYPNPAGVTSGYPNPTGINNGYPNPNSNANGFPNPTGVTNGYPNPTGFGQGVSPNLNANTNGYPNPSGVSNGYPNPTGYGQQVGPNPRFPNGPIPGRRFPGPMGQMGQPGAGSGADLIRNILTSPRPGGPPPGVLPGNQSPNGFDSNTAQNIDGQIPPPQNSQNVLSSGGTSSFSSQTGGSGFGSQTVGGGIAGVASKFERQGIKIYSERDKYNEWEFIYDFGKDSFYGANQGQRPGGMQQNGQGQTGSGGNGFGGSGFGTGGQGQGGSIQNGQGATSGNFSNSVAAPPP